MNASELLTPSMVELVLPLLGFSILLNFVLILALMVRSFHRQIVQQLYLIWLGIALLWQTNKQSSQKS